MNDGAIRILGEIIQEYGITTDEACNAIGHDSIGGMQGAAGEKEKIFGTVHR